MKYRILPTDETIEKTAEALRRNGIEVEVLENGIAAKQRVLELLPAGAEVMNMVSMTLEETGIAEAINAPGAYQSLRNTFKTFTEADARKKQQLGAAPDWAVGSVHAVTENGTVVIASNTGSQLPAYAYGSNHVIWVVGAHKIVADLNAAMKRIYDYVLPLEAERARKAYGSDGSNVSKVLIVNKEVKQGRLRLLLVKEVLGY